MNYFQVYYRGVKHPSTKTRYDVIASSGTYDFFESLLINKKNPNKGGLSFYISDQPSHFGKRPERKADKIISKHSFSISSIIIPDPRVPWGLCDVNGTDDAFLVHLSDDWSEIEIFISLGQKNNKLNLYQLAVDGELDVEIAYMRKNAKARR